MLLPLSLDMLIHLQSRFNFQSLHLYRSSPKLKLNTRSAVGLAKKGLVLLANERNTSHCLLMIVIGFGLSLNLVVRILQLLGHSGEQEHCS
jgi:hypothetical protein